MNMQALMREAQKMQKELQKTQKELEDTLYEGSSSLVFVKMNGRKELVSVEIKKDNDFNSDDLDMLEDMIMIAVNDAGKKVDKDKENKMSKYGNGLGGLL